jgi:lantibiotic biosynthesis protein
MSSDGTFLATADAIGRRIVADAVWSDGACSWVGAIAEPAPPWRAQYRALGPVVYDGTAGVGLFLAQLAMADDGEAIRWTAVGALRHAVTRVPARSDGFHAGSLGVAWATARSAALLGDEELDASARTLASAAKPVGGECHDVVAGGAGSVIALLALAELWEDRTLVDEAIATGNGLIDAATVTRHGWSWGSPDRRGRAHVCGLAHGTAGIGWALLELFAVTGDKRFLAGALGAFAYERSWLDADSGTWPDLRIGGQRRGAPRQIAPPTLGTWCSGEAGIALTRVRALEVLGIESCEDDADVALTATRRELARLLDDDIDDLTLCHGAAGVAEALRCAGPEDGTALAYALGHQAIERYGATNDDWPCGPAGGASPSLFRGLSGIGWWFLRLHDAAIPSPLMLPTLTAVCARA